MNDFTDFTIKRFHSFTDSLFCLHLLSSHTTVAWYKVLDVKHDPFIGLSSLIRQLHNFCGSVAFGFSTFLLWQFFWFDVWHAQITNFYCVFVFTNLWLGRKCLLINLTDVLPIVAFTDLLYGGLNQIMLHLRFFLFWLFSFGCWYCSLFLYPLLFRHFHRKWQTPEKYFSMKSKLRAYFQLTVKFIEWLMAGDINWREYS